MKTPSDEWKKTYAQMYPRTAEMRAGVAKFAEANYKRKVTNEQFSKQDKEFQQACSNAGLAPSARQASKYRNKKGKAFNEGR